MSQPNYLLFDLTPNPRHRDVQPPALLSRHALKITTPSKGTKP